MGFTFCALSGSILDLAVRNAMLQGKSSVQMRPPARYLVVLLRNRPMASAKSIHIDTGTADQRYRLDLPQDVADQVRHMFTKWVHVP